MVLIMEKEKGFQLDSFDHSNVEFGVDLANPNLVGIYECQGCSELYTTEPGEHMAAPICPKSTCQETDMIFIGEDT